MAASLLNLRFRYTLDVFAIKLVDISKLPHSSSQLSWISNSLVPVYNSGGEIVGEIDYPIWVAAFKNCWLNNNSSFIIDRKNKIAYADLAHLDEENTNYTNKPVIFTYLNRAIYLSKQLPTVYIEKGIFLGGKASYNYYHLMIEIIPRLYVINRQPQYRDYPLIVDEVMMRIPQYCSIVHLFRKEGQEIIELRADKKYKVSELVVANDGARMPINVFDMSAFTPYTCYILPEGMAYVRQQVMNFLKKNPQHTAPAYSRIFIARKPSLSRRPSNEEELWTIAQKYGFVKVYPEDYSFPEQVSIFSNCEIVLGNTGAAFTNILFMAPGSKILYWVSELNKEINFFTTLAKFNNCSICYIAGLPNEGDYSMHGYFHVNTAAFEDKLRQIINL